IEYTKKLFQEYQRLLALQGDDEEEEDDASTTPDVPPSKTSTSKLSIRDIKPPKPSVYMGTRELIKVTNWLDEVDQYVTHFNLNTTNGEAVNTAAMWMSGNAGIWWRRIKACPEGPPRTWTAFHDLVLTSFVPRNALENIWEQLHNLRQVG